MMSTRCVNGRVETIDICLRCYWRERFEAEGRGGERMNGGVSDKEGIRTIDPASSINPLGLRERV